MNIYFACSITGGREFESVYQNLIASLPVGSADLIEYVKYAVSAADGFFDIRVARAELERSYGLFDHPCGGGKRLPGAGVPSG